MAGKLDRIESMLRTALGDALLSRCPELVYTVNQSIVRFMRTSATLPELLKQIDSALFNAVYTGTGGTIVVTGTPEQIAACPESRTGEYLKKILK